MQQKKTKKNYFKKSAQGNANLSEVMSGFLITCDRNREKNAVREAYQIIE